MQSALGLSIPALIPPLSARTPRAEPKLLACVDKRRGDCMLLERASGNELPKGKCCSIEAVVSCPDLSFIATQGSRMAGPPPHADHCQATHLIVADLIHRFAAPLTSACQPPVSTRVGIMAARHPESHHQTTDRLHRATRHCIQVISAGYAFIQNIRRGHYELGTEEVVNLRVKAVFDELALAI